MPTPFISVLIDTYNHERFIEEAVQSVLAQDFPACDREIIVVDDGSTDKTPQLLKKFEPQIRVLRKQNEGQASAFNLGIPECRGEFVAFLDADDWWAPDKVTRVINAMTENPEIGFVGHGIVTVFEDGTRNTEILRDGFRFQANTMAGALLFSRRGAFMGTSRMTIRKSLLQMIGEIPAEIRIQADEYLYTLASVLMPMRILPEALTFYRLHADNGFQFSASDPVKLRRKQQSLAALVKTLSLRLTELGISPDVRQTLLTYTKACSDQLRLILDGGWPWETLRTEWNMYRVTHPDAPNSHRLFKSLTLLAALLTTPKSFYRAQSSLAQNGFYRQLRDKLLPFPEMQHIQKDEQTRR
jgi:glycosyltransferase involved in cell wall biosynthesis